MVGGLHELAHRAGHTVFVIGGPGSDPAAVEALLAEAEAAGGPAGVGASFGFVTDADAGERLGWIETATAEQLEVDDVALFAVRPDRYIGLRRDEADAAALAEYLRTLAA